MFDQAYISALSALAGTFIGAITSITTTWVGQRYQTKAQRVASEKTERQKLYKQFILEASKVYLDSLEHEQTEIAKFIDVYTTINRMRILSSRPVIDEADKAMRIIISSYFDKNKTFYDVATYVNKGFPDPLRAFSEACRNELEPLLL